MRSRFGDRRLPEGRGNRLTGRGTGFCPPPPGQADETAGRIVAGLHRDPCGLQERAQAVLDRADRAAHIRGQTRIGGPADGLVAGIAQEHAREDDRPRIQAGVDDQLVRQGGEGERVHNFPPS